MSKVLVENLLFLNLQKSRLCGVGVRVWGSMRQVNAVVFILFIL